MIKKILVSLSLVFASVAMAQQGTATPYSYYGLGNVNYNGTNEYKAMGGTSVYADSIHINLKNPASFAKLKYTTLSLGATAHYYRFKSDQNKDEAKRQSFDYFALGFPVAKNVGVVFGLLPYSNVGYKVMGDETSNTTGRITTQSFTGDGGVNRAFIGAGYQITDNFSFGFDAGYHFGDTDNKMYTWIKDLGDGTPAITQTLEHRNLDYTGFSYNLSAQYQGKFKQYDIQANVTYAPETNWDVKNKTTVGIYDIYSPNLPIKEITALDEKMKFVNPQNLTFGAGIGKISKWFVSGQFTYTQNSKLGNIWNTTNISDFEDTRKYAIGGFYIPKYNSFTSYFDRIVYRAGIRYENTGLVLKQQAIKDYGLSIGFGLPVRGLTNINVGFEYGQRGTTNHDLLKENYFNMSIGFSLNDIWFKRRKYE
ncbi:outer membrane protein transport protein [Myroides sp. LJL119]